MRTAAAICRELTADRRTDGELLAAFAAGPSEDAFAELVRRHGPLVWGACRRLLPDPSDAEDAFQAAFLVLVRRARGLTRCTTLGPWLHRVAVWTARNVRRKNARRLARQSALPEHVPDPAPRPDPDLKADLDAALLALPARYRDPILLCHLQGFSRREAAERLGCAEGTLSAWLNRGLAKLRDRLRGLDPAKVLGVGIVSVPAALTATTARAAVATAVAAAGVPPAVSSLVEGVLHMFWVKKATAAAFALCAVFALGTGVGLSTRTDHSGVAAQEKAAPPGATPKAAAPAPAKEIAALELEIAISQTEQQAFAVAVKAATERLQLTKKAVVNGNGSNVDLLDDTLTVARFQESLETATARLKEMRERLAKLKGTAMKTDTGYIELTIGGKAGEFEFVIREFPPNDPKEFGVQRVYGPVTTRDPEMLKRLLTRAKADPTGPQEARVIVQPQTVFGMGPRAALKACDAAGYKTVAFTGYVFGGGFAVELKADQKGDVRGYKRYDAVEVKPAELVKEIEEGLRRF